MTAKEYLEQSQIKDSVVIRVHEKKDKVTEIKLSDLLNNFTRHIAKQAVKEEMKEWRSVSVEIQDRDIATIEALHDLLLDAHGYSLDFTTLKRARELTAKMYKAFK